MQLYLSFRDIWTESTAGENRKWVNYLLVTDSEEDDGECLILRDTSEDQDQESLYEIVEDEKELDAVLTVFEELLDDVDIER